MCGFHGSNSSNTENYNGICEQKTTKYQTTTQQMSDYLTNTGFGNYQTQ